MLVTILVLPVTSTLVNKGQRKYSKLVSHIDDFKVLANGISLVVTSSLNSHSSAISVKIEGRSFAYLNAVPLVTQHNCGVRYDSNIYQ